MVILSRLITRKGERSGGDPVTHLATDTFADDSSSSNDDDDYKLFFVLVV